MLFSERWRAWIRRSRAFTNPQLSHRKTHPRSPLLLEQLEDRITPTTGNITLTNVSVVDATDTPLTTINPGEHVYIHADFTTQNLPADASYRIAYTVNGMTLETPSLSVGAGMSSGTWYETWGYFLPTPGTNQVSVTVDPDQSVAESDYSDNTKSTTFTAVSPPMGNPSYSVAQIRDAYGLNSLPNFGATAADGSGQTIAIVDAFNDPTILSDLDGFDQAMNLTLDSTQNLYQQYGPASSFLTVYNQDGTDITSTLNTSGLNGVPNVDPTGSWEGEETMDVEWAHAMAPGAKIALIETNGTGSFDDLFTGAATAANLPGVTAVSMSWIWSESDWGDSSGETGLDSSTFVTPPAHPGVTFLAGSGDGGTPGGYPAFSPNVVAVGATQLALNNNAYDSETAWSFPTPITLDFGSAAFTYLIGTWSAQTGGFTGNYATAAAGSNSQVSWTTPITAADQGWFGGTEVSATWTANASNATNATYKIYDGTNLATAPLLGTVTVDQTKAPVGISDGNTQFQELGDFYSSSGHLTVVLDANTANGTVVADTIGIAPAWATGGAPSQYETEPSYQLPFQNSGQRTTPDVSFDGSINSGVTCYQGGIGYGYFGTSLSSPCWAGLIAIANQGRVAAGGSTFNSSSNPTQTLQALYSLPSRDFNDITTGYNGYSASPGYDYITGRGTPIANLLIPDLVDFGTAPTVTGISPSSGPTAGGTSVTITGTDFTASSTVEFGSTPATSVTVNSSTSITAIAPPESAGKVDVTVTTEAGTSATSNADQFTFGASPTITGNPTDQTVLATGTATFTAAASGDPAPTVQWQVSTDGGKTFTDLNGETSTTLTLSNVTAAMNGNEYRAVFTNNDGTATTSTAFLAVQYAPTVTSNPSDQSATVGQNAVFTVAANGNPTPTVQWQVSTDGGKTFTDINGETSTTLILSSVTAAMDGNEYQAVFTNYIGSTTTTAATLTVNSASTVTTNPSDQTVTAGQNVTFTAAANGNPTPTVQWQVSTDSGKTFSNLNGATTATLTLNSVTAAMNGNEYRAVFTNSTGTATTTAATLTVDFAPTVTTNPSDQTAIVGQNATFTAAASGNPTPTVQWQVSTDGGKTFTDINGETSTTLTLGSVTADMDDNEYQAVFTNSAGTATTTAATLSVNSAPTVTTNPSDQTATAGQNATFTAAASGNPAPTVQWQVSSDGGKTFTDISGETSTTLTLTAVAAMNGNEYQAVFTNSAGTATTTAATLTVNSAPTVTTNPSNQTVTAGQNATFTAAASGNPAPTVQWQVSTDGGKTFTDISGATTATLTLNSVQASQNGNQYRAVFTNSVGTADSSAATLAVLVAPLVTTQPASQLATVGGTITFTAAASGNPTPTVQWQVSTNNGAAFTDISGATSTTLTLTNVQTSQNGTVYRAVFTNSAGAADSSLATLTVQTANTPAISSQQGPALHIPSLLALINQFVGGTETINTDGTVTLTYSLYGITLLVVNFDSSGNFASGTLLGINVPNWMWFV